MYEEVNYIKLEYEKKAHNNNLKDQSLLILFH